MSVKVKENVVCASMWFEYTDANTPKNPEAKRGDFSEIHLAETKEQLAQNLIWDRCPFCGGYVMIQTWLAIHNHSREKCRCGAKRLERYLWKNKEPVGLESGWKKNGEEWTSIE